MLAMKIKKTMTMISEDEEGPDDDDGGHGVREVIYVSLCSKRCLHICFTLFQHVEVNLMSAPNLQKPIITNKCC